MAEVANKLVFKFTEKLVLILFALIVIQAAAASLTALPCSQKQLGLQAMKRLHMLTVEDDKRAMLVDITPSSSSSSSTTSEGGVGDSPTTTTTNMSTTTAQALSQQDNIPMQARVHAQQRARSDERAFRQLMKVYKAGRPPGTAFNSHEPLLYLKVNGVEFNYGTLLQYDNFGARQ